VFQRTQGVVETINLVLDLKAKLDGAGYYDAYEVDRVVKVLMNPKTTQGDLVGAIGPVADRLLKTFSGAKADKLAAEEAGNEAGAKTASDTMNALILFKGDMATFVRVYTFLSQIFDYGNTDVEKRFLFFKHLIRLLEFGRERDTVDTSQLVLTHHTVKSLGKTPFDMGGDKPTLAPVGDAGSGSVQEKQTALLREIIERVNGLFDAETSESDQLLYVNGFLKNRMLASQELAVQAKNNTQAQFDNSPALRQQMIDAAMDSEAAFSSMSHKVLASEVVREELLKILLGPGQLYEALRGG